MLSILEKATRKEKIDEINRLANKMTPKVRRAFLLALKTLQKDIPVKELEAAIASSNMSEALRLVNAPKLERIMTGVGIEAGTPSFKEELQVVFAAGAATAIGQLPKKVSLNLAFDVFNPRAIAWADQRAGTLIRQVTEATQNGVRAIITDSVSTGVAPRKAARRIRELVGLTDLQARAVINFRAQLESKNNLGKQPAWMRRLSAPEKAIVRRHMKEGGLTQPRIDALVNRYQQSLTNKRATDIARTEALNAVQAGQLESWKQAKEQGLLPDEVKRKWVVTPDDRLREDHAAIPHMNPDGVGLEEDFQTPFGPVDGPHDSNVHLINCRCTTVLTNL